MMWLVGCLLLLALLYYAWKALQGSLWVLTTGGARDGGSPFHTIFTSSPAPLVASHGERDKVLKQSFSPEKIPESLDAVVVGELQHVHACGTS